MKYDVLIIYYLLLFRGKKLNAIIDNSIRKTLVYDVSKLLRLLQVPSFHGNAEFVAITIFILIPNFPQRIRHKRKKGNKQQFLS